MYITLFNYLSIRDPFSSKMTKSETSEMSLTQPNASQTNTGWRRAVTWVAQTQTLPNCKFKFNRSGLLVDVSTNFVRASKHLIDVRFYCPSRLET